MPNSTNLKTWRNRITGMLSGIEKTIHFLVLEKIGHSMFSLCSLVYNLNHDTIRNTTHDANLQ